MGILRKTNFGFEREEKQNEKRLHYETFGTTSWDFDLVFWIYVGYV